MKQSAAHARDLAPRVVLAVDPGSAKCGVAVVASPPLTIARRCIVPTPELIEAVGKIVAACPRIDAIIMGDGTGSQRLAKALQEAHADRRFEIVDEFRTSEAARCRYCRENPARGWRRLLPRGLRAPEEPYDDYAAVILAERWLMTASAAAGEPGSEPSGKYRDMS